MYTGNTNGEELKENTKGSCTYRHNWQCFTRWCQFTTEEL